MPLGVVPGSLWAFFCKKVFHEKGGASNMMVFTIDLSYFRRPDRPGKQQMSEKKACENSCISGSEKQILGRFFAILGSISRSSFACF